MAGARCVGVLGSGDVAKALGGGFAKHGYEVMLGTRDPKQLEAWAHGAAGHVAVGSFAQAAGYGPVVVPATHGGATEAALDLAGPASFAGKLVVDATNPLDSSHGRPPGLLFGLTASLGERVQRKLPAARVVKCFNTVRNTRMVDPKFSSGPARMWICGNDAAAKRETEAILREFGWAGVFDVGGIDSARWLQAMVPLWVRAGLSLNAFDHILQPVR